MLDGMDSIRRDFLVKELNEVRGEASIDAVVTVQARQSLRETDWLLELASGHDFMLAVVGWAPLADPQVGLSFGKLCGSHKAESGPACTPR